MKRTHPYYLRSAKKMRTTRIKYPTTERDETIIENKFGTLVSDPYRWLEDPENPKTKEWVEKQNELSMDYINSCKFNDKIKDKLKDIINYPKYSSPSKHGNKYYFYKNDGLQNHSVMYVQNTLDSEPTVFFDPNTLSEDGSTSLDTSAFSETGKLWAYGLSKNGSDWENIYVRDVNTGTDFPDELKWVKFSGISWTHDDKGFFYSRYPIPDNLQEDKAGQETGSYENHMVYYHQVGTSQDNDILIYRDPLHPKYYLGGGVTDDGKYLIIIPNDGCKEEHRVLYAKLNDLHNLQIIPLIDDTLAKWEYITSVGDEMYFLTNHNAPNKRVASININDHVKQRRLRVAQTDDVLEDVCCVNEKYLILTYMKDVKNVVQLHNLEGNFIQNIQLPGPGSVGVNGDKHQDEFFYSYTSFLNPKTIFRYSFKENKTSVFKEIIVPGFNPNLYNAEQVFYNSKDGTKIPMFIISSKNSKRDGNSPVYLYGYGGFGVSITPSFSAMYTVLLNNLGVTLAIANIRGGGEYGKTWHDAGMKEHKQNVFDDFHSAGEYLINHKYTNSGKLIINGGSNGGLLVGACINQRPDLYGCAIAEVGVMDMLRFHKFTCGFGWTSDYGNPDVEDEFKYIYPYSPLHNINQSKPYPAVLLTTADHDDRVVPLHSYKYIATLQHDVGTKSYQDNPLLIKVEVNTGHGHSKPISKIIEEEAQQYAFMANALDLQWRD